MPHERYVRAADIRGVKGSRLPPGRALTPDEIARLRAFCAEETGIFGALLRGVIAVLLGGGARREEACTLEVTSFDGESLEILGKGNKERRVPLSFEARRDLAAWVDVRDTLALTIDALFVRAQRDGRLRKRPFSPDGMYELIVWLGEASGVGELATHDLRRTFATARLDAGVDVLVVQRLLGHASPATTAKYDMRAEREARRAVENAEVY
jgi:integrase/recombinase XerD